VTVPLHSFRSRGRGKKRSLRGKNLAPAKIVVHERRGGEARWSSPRGEKKKPVRNAGERGEGGLTVKPYFHTSLEKKKGILANSGVTERKGGLLLHHLHRKRGQSSVTYVKGGERTIRGLINKRGRTSLHNTTEGRGGGYWGGKGRPSHLRLPLKKKEKREKLPPIGQQGKEHRFRLKEGGEKRFTRLGRRSYRSFSILFREKGRSPSQPPFSPKEKRKGHGFVHLVTKKSKTARFLEP